MKNEVTVNSITDTGVLFSNMPHNSFGIVISSDTCGVNTPYRGQVVQRCRDRVFVVGGNDYWIDIDHVTLRVRVLKPGESIVIKVLE